MGAQFFIVFPEKSAMGTTSNYFETNSIPSNYVAKISETMRLFAEVCQMDSFTFYYDRANLENFRSAFVADKYALRMLESVAKRALEWNDQTCSQPGVCQCATIWNVSQYAHNSLCEAALRKRIQKGRMTVAVIQYELPNLNMSTLPVEIGKYTIDLSIVPLTLFDMHKWISENRAPQRVYLWNPKHGEFHNPEDVLEGRYVSVLCGSRYEAESLLPYAIGVVKDNEKFRLYLFDEKHHVYEVFMPSVGTYHSYHVLDNEVPVEIRNNLEKINRARKYN